MQDVQSCSETAGAKPLERFRRVQTVQLAESKANFVHHEDTVYERQGVPVLGCQGPCTAGSPALTGLYSGQRVARFASRHRRPHPHRAWDSLLKVFDNGSPKLDLQSSVWKCPNGKLETPQREQNATDSSAPAAFRKHFRRKSSGPTIASHVDVTCPPEVWGRALEAPARAKLVVGRSRR